VQKYGKFPTLLKVCVNTAPWFKIIESQRPFGIPGEPEVLLCPLELHVQRTVSPGSIVTDEGEKKNPPLPTATSTVLAVAALGYRTRKIAVASTNSVVRCEKVFMMLARLPGSDRKIANTRPPAQEDKSDAVVTFGIVFAKRRHSGCLGHSVSVEH
jgi:hypothetical protein